MIKPFDSAYDSASNEVRRSISPNRSGSASASSSTGTRWSFVKPSIRPPTSSTSEAVTDGVPASRHRPSTVTSRPVSTAPRINSRAYSGLPRLRSRIQRIDSSSTGPSSAASTSARTASSLRRSSSSRCAPASFHSETIASGQGSPERTVATTKTPESVARCSTSAADAGSSRWASSTPRMIGRPAARSRSARALSRSSVKPWSERTDSGTRRANAPSGIIAALRVACTHSASVPSRSARNSASRPRRDLPAPASALTTTPQRPCAPARAIIASSSSRPTSGHCALPGTNANSTVRC